MLSATPTINLKNVGVRQQGRTIIQAATAVSDSFTISAVMGDRDAGDWVLLIFSCTENYYINTRAAATAPSGDDVTGSAPLLNPESLLVPGNIDTINFASEVPANLHIEIFRS